jgi:hypothetical protein
MKAERGVDVKIHILLASTLVVGEWSASHPRPIYPRRKSLQVPIG